MTAEEIVLFIANEPVELSAEKAKAQRDHFKSLARSWKEKTYDNSDIARLKRKLEDSGIRYKIYSENKIQIGWFSFSSPSQALDHLDEFYVKDDF